MDPDYLNIYFREIVYHNPSIKKDSVCGVFSYEAINIEETRLGNLYLVGKISGFSPKKHKNYDFLLNLLASGMKREFYIDPQKGTLEALESALQSANIYLADFTKKGHKEWIGNIDFTCIAFSHNEIHIGQTGNMIIYLLRGDTISNVARKFANTTSTKKIPQPSKTFSNIASGNLEENDKIIISTANISNIIPQQKIKELLFNSSTEQLYNYLKNRLEAKDSKTDSLASLLLEARSKPSIVIEKEISIIKEEPKITSIDAERILNSKANKFNNLLKTKISSSSKLSRILPLLKYNTPKYLIAFFIFLSVVLSPYIVQKIDYDLRLKRIDNLIKRTKEIISKSEISLVYQNQFEARGLLQQASILIANASSIIAELPEQVKEKSSQNLQVIEQEISSQKNSINNVINIEQPEQIADLSKNTFTFNPNGILKMGNNLFLYELTSGFLYKINLDDLESPILIFLSSKDTFKLGVVRENNLALLSTPDKIYIYGKNDNYNTYLLKPSLENTLHIKDMAQYGNNLYFLNAEKLNILKYVPEENSLAGSNWLNETFREDLIDAQSLAVDGSVYIATKNGTINEYVSGKRSKQIKPDIIPPLNQIDQIFTGAEMKKLYILDSKNRRIIVVNKNDGLTIQYVSNAFNSLKDLWVDQDETTIYLLNEFKVYRINI